MRLRDFGGQVSKVALTISSSHFSQDWLTLGDAIGEIKLRVQENELESLLDAAPFLYALGRNRNFLIEALTKETIERGPVQTIGLQDTSLVLYHDARLVIRANFWFPRDGFPAAHASRVNSFGYLTPHNHDFDFLTLGYWGPGYRTAIYEGDIKSANAISAGDRVDLVFLENTELLEGKLMIYRAIKDVHWQEHPSAFSVSLNVALLPRHRYMGQHLFDIGNKSVRAVLDHSRSQILACKLAAVLRDESLLANLYEVKTNSTDYRIVAAANAAIGAILGQSNGPM